MVFDVGLKSEARHKLVGPYTELFRPDSLALAQKFDRGSRYSRIATFRRSIRGYLASSRRNLARTDRGS